MNIKLVMMTSCCLYQSTRNFDEVCFALLSASEMGAAKYSPKYSTIDSRLILFFTGGISKLWILPESIIKQDASAFLIVGEHTMSRSPPDAFLKALF